MSKLLKMWRKNVETLPDISHHVRRLLYLPRKISQALTFWTKIHAFNTVQNIYVCLFVDKWLNLCKQTLFHLAGGDLKPFSSISFGFITGFFFSLIKYQNCDFPYSWRYDRLGSVVKVHYGSFKQKFFCMAYGNSDSTLWCRPR